MSKQGVVTFLVVIFFVVTVGNLVAQRRGGPGQGPGMGASGASMDKDPVAKDEAEKKILDILDVMNKEESRGMMNVPPEDGRLLRMLAETTNAQKVVEIGTSNGYSGIWWALALRKTGGKLITHDIDEGRASQARKNFARAGVEDIITLVMGDAHETVKKLEGPIDILFLDADKSGYMDYMNQLVPKVRAGGLIIAHNTTNAGPQMQDYIKEITTNPNLDTLFLHQDRQGLSVTLKKR